MSRDYLVTIVVFTLFNVVVFTWSPPSVTFCSAVCKPNNCTNSSPNGCKSCDTDFMMSGSTCVVNPSSGWTFQDASSDLGGNLVVNKSGSPTGSCGSYNYFGNLTSSETVMVSSVSGISNPFYSLEIIYWVILIDSWDSGTTVSTVFDPPNSQKNSSYSSAKQSTTGLCGGKSNEDYLKISHSWSYNQTNLQLDFSVKMLNNKQNDPWGVKQFQLLAKYCNINCTSCWSGSITNCWSCVSGMLLNNNTCNQSCLAGFGQTTDGMTCIWCNLRCTSCFQTMSNCSACTTNGTWKSFLVVDNFTCVKTCPAGYFGNISTSICDPCDPICQTCGISSTHCYSCIPSYGWNSYYCYNPCPIGTYTDLTHPVYNGSINCTSCSKYCIQCTGPSTVCTSCTLSGANQAYLLNSTCYQNCPINYYEENYNNTGPNECVGCDISCATCTNNPSPCQSCNPSFYLYQSVCGTSCPQPAYFPDNATWTCLDCSIHCVDLTIKIYFPNNINSEMYIDMNFTQPLNFSSFPIETFQTITTDSSLVTLNMFNVEYVQTGPNSYRIILTPKGYIFIYNVTFTVTTINQPTPIDYSKNDIPFKSTNYQKSANLKWFLIKAPSMNSLEQSIINGLSTINDKVSMITTLPFVQQIKKTGVFSLLMGGAQITSCSILVNTIPAQNMYEGVRFWAMFVFFDVPKWEQNSNKTKYVVVPSQNKLIQNARLLTVEEKQRMLFDTSSVDWRFQRTGHTSFFIFDCYMNIFMIIFCWILVITGHCVIKKKKSLKKHMGKFYSLLHKVHQITILYISLATLLEWIYFDATSIQRWISFGSCLFANLYFLIYELYIYYDMLNYPKAQIGTNQYEYYLMKYGSLLKNIRYEQFDFKEDWSPKQWFRPYNYHFISYYKKLMMMISLPLFYNIENTQIYVLIFIQILEILRFCFTWPFKSKVRNIMRLILQFVLLSFFLTVSASQYTIQKIVQFDPISQMNELQTYITIFYGIGWASFILVFLFNIGFLSIFIYDICLGCKKSNRQLMDQARRNFYMQKLKSYEQDNESVPLGMVNKWVKLGNLNKRNFEELPNIKIRIQYFRITKSQKGGFWIQMKKLLDLYMNVEFNFQKQNNITVSQKINKNFWLKRTLSSQFFQKISDLYEQYSEKYQFQSMTIKTFYEVQQSEYKPGDKIKIITDKISQKVELHTYNNETKVIPLKNIISGFPIQQSLLSYL